MVVKGLRPGHSDCPVCAAMVVGLLKKLPSSVLLPFKSCAPLAIVFFTRRSLAAGEAAAAITVAPPSSTVEQ